MALQNKVIRERLRMYAGLFVAQNCQYDDGHENEAVNNLLKMLHRVDPACEELNNKTPNHGKKITA